MNIFFEISNIDKQSKIAIDIFLDDLCKWCIAELKSIIEYLLKDNLNQLRKELLKEQLKNEDKHNEKYLEQ